MTPCVSAIMKNISIDRLAWTISQSQHVVVMSGAGLSVSSGIPTFRDRMKALWSQFDPMEVASLSGFEKAPDKVWFWHQQMKEVVAAASPNPAHLALAELAKLLPPDGCTVITQNIDGLHTAAGSPDVIELHGNIGRLRCHARCGYVTKWAISTEQIPACPQCGAPLRPDVVWFEELLNNHDMQRAQQVSEECDVFVLAGTTALVHPAASLPQLAKANDALLVEINPEKTNISCEADVVICGLAEEVLPVLIEETRKRCS